MKLNVGDQVYVDLKTIPGVDRRQLRQDVDVVKGTITSCVSSSNTVIVEAKYYSKESTGPKRFSIYKEDIIPHPPPSAAAISRAIRDLRRSICEIRGGIFLDMGD